MNSMIQTIDLTKKFGDFTANDHINLDVKEQEIKCIVGENGAGKSTMIKLLMRFYDVKKYNDEHALWFASANKR